MGYQQRSLVQLIGLVTFSISGVVTTSSANADDCYDCQIACLDRKHQCNKQVCLASGGTPRPGADVCDDLDAAERQRYIEGVKVCSAAYDKCWDNCWPNPCGGQSKLEESSTSTNDSTKKKDKQGVGLLSVTDVVKRMWSLRWSDSEESARPTWCEFEQPNDSSMGPLRHDTIVVRVSRNGEWAAKWAIDNASSGRATAYGKATFEVPNTTIFLTPSCTSGITFRDSVVAGQSPLEKMGQCPALRDNFEQICVESQKALFIWTKDGRE
jgi:hypothetical protein